MTHHPIADAFQSVDATPSANFRQELRGQFLTALSEPDAGDTAVATDSVTVTALVPPPRRRMKVAVAVAASIALVAALAAVVVSHHSEPTSVDTSHDGAIAQAALLSPKQIGVSWAITHQFDNFTSRDVADLAATVPACAPYVDYAFDSPHRDATTAGRIFASAPLFAVTQWVYIFPTDAAASKAMDKISEASFVPCMNQFMDALAPRLAGSPSHTTNVEVPPLSTHGDRQVVIGQSVAFDGSLGTFTIMNVFIQVGRGIVFVNPTPDTTHDSGDPAGRLEKVMTAATTDLRMALETSGD